MKTLKTILLFITIAFIVIILQHKYYPRIVNETIVVHDTIRDTTEIVKYYPKPVPYFVDTGKTDTVYIPPDSLAIVSKYLALHSLYYTKNYYTDTLLNDTSALIVFSEIIFKNEPAARQLNFINRRATAINTTINNTNISKRQLFLGIDAGINSIQPGIILKGKNDIQLKLSYELGVNSGIRAGVYFTPGSILDIIKKNNPKQA